MFPRAKLCVIEHLTLAKMLVHKQLSSVQWNCSLEYDSVKQFKWAIRTSMQRMVWSNYLLWELVDLKNILASIGSKPGCLQIKFLMENVVSLLSLYRVI